MTAEIGHHPNRMYISDVGDVHVNGSKFFNNAEQDISGALNAPFVHKTGNYTFTLADAGKFFVLDSGSPTWTLDSFANVAYPFMTNSAITVYNAGSGTLTIAITGAATINGVNGSRTISQNGAASLIPDSADVWIIAGNFT
jgi:hypothetical protein